MRYKIIHVTMGDKFGEKTKKEAWRKRESYRNPELRKAIYPDGDIRWQVLYPLASILQGQRRTK